jgi:hypothetical protein
VQPSIATHPDSAGARTAPHFETWLNGLLDRLSLTHIGLFFVVLALVVYVFSDPSRIGWYNHFVWQADAWLHGRFVISYPVSTGAYQNAYLNDVMPLPSSPGEPSYGLLPFPPLPAVLLLPFVAVFGLATDAQLFGAVLGAINIGLTWRMLTRVTGNRAAIFMTTLFFAFGTAHWYSAMLSTTWFLAHVVATTFLLLGITIALDAERREQLRAKLGHLADPAAGGLRSAPGPRGSLTATFEQRSVFLRWYRTVRAQIDPLQFMAGFVFGLAALSRLTTVLGAPFFVLIGGGGSFWRRAFSAGLGAILPGLLLLAYNVASSGHIFNPAYDWLFHTEYHGYMPSWLPIDETKGLEDIANVPRNALIMFGWMPTIDLSCGLSFLNPNCALIKPDPIGMSILLTSPAYLLGVPLAIQRWRNRLVLGAILATVAIGFGILMNFGPGWVQFGFRRSLDFAPFALILVALAMARYGVGRVTAALVAFSILVNAWGVYWGVALRW